MFCPNCGQARQGAERFCVNCGTDLTNQLGVVPSPVTGAPTPMAVPAVAPLAPPPATAQAAPPPAVVPAAPAVAPGSLVGVDGWLLLFCVYITTISPLLEVVRLIPAFRYLGANPTLLLALGLTAYGIFTGIMLWTRNPIALACLRIYFALVLVFALVGGFTFFRAVRMTGMSYGMFAVVTSWLRVAAFLAIWVSYFRVSKRVRATYGANL